MPLSEWEQVKIWLSSPVWSLIDARLQEQLRQSEHTYRLTGEEQAKATADGIDAFYGVLKEFENRAVLEQRAHEAGRLGPEA